MLAVKVLACIGTTELVFATIGVPEITPLLDNVSPAGKLPEVTV
jgi:hypothetical protein